MSFSQDIINSQISVNPAQQIAQNMTISQYFLNEQDNLLEQLKQKSLQTLNLIGQVFINQYNMKTDTLTNNFKEQFETNYTKCRKQFEAFCLLSRKVQKKADQIENIAIYINKKNTKRTFFYAWKNHHQEKQLLRKLENKADKYYESNQKKKILKIWQQIMMKSNRTQIKHEVLHKTEIQICRIQTQYQKLIKGLQDNLQKRLNELAKQQAQHKFLHEKFNTLYTRSQVKQ